jgi:hypothetical protein
MASRTICIEDSRARYTGQDMEQLGSLGLKEVLLVMHDMLCLTRFWIVQSDKQGATSIVPG